MSEEPEILCSGRFLRLVRTGRWEYAERTHAGGAVAIVAVTPDEELVLVEQYRPAVAAPVIELPAGLVGDTEEFAGEAWQATAARELLEETGYRARRFALLAEGPTTPGLSNEHVILARAFDLEKVDAGGGDAHEDITVHTVPLYQADDWLRRRATDGITTDAKVYAGLYFAAEGP